MKSDAGHFRATVLLVLAVYQNVTSLLLVIRIGTVNRVLSVTAHLLAVLGPQACCTFHVTSSVIAFTSMSQAVRHPVLFQNNGLTGSRSG